MVDIDVIGEDAWQVLLDVRLRALRDSPLALGPTLEREQGFREQHWRMRLRSSPWFVAHEVGGRDDAAIGLASVISEPGAAEDDRHVVALWVEPTRRRLGIGTALVDAAARAARAGHARTLSLWVAEGNDEALGLCVGYGFVPTGERHVMASTPGRAEARYELPLRA